jgi:hypothetical protein
LIGKFLTSNNYQHFPHKHDMSTPATTVNAKLAAIKARRAAMEEEVQVEKKWAEKEAAKKAAEEAKKARAVKKAEKKCKANEVPVKEGEGSVEAPKKKVKGKGNEQEVMEGPELEVAAVPCKKWVAFLDSNLCIVDILLDIL